MTDYFLFYTFRSQIRFLQMKKSPLFTLPLRQTLFCEFPPMVISTAVFGKCPTKGAFLYTFSPLYPFVLDCQLFVYWHKRKRKSISKELVISLIQFKWWPPFVCNSHCHLFRQDIILLLAFIQAASGLFFSIYPIWYFLRRRQRDASKLDTLAMSDSFAAHSRFNKIKQKIRIYF